MLLMRLRMLQKDFSTQTSDFFQLLKFDNKVTENIYKLPEQNKLNKMACLKKCILCQGYCPIPRHS